MKLKNGFLLGSLFVSLFSGACVPVVARGNSLIRFHHGNATGSAYWMTVSASRTDGRGFDVAVDTSIWYCSAEDRAEPTCRQAKLKACEARDASCTMTAAGVSLDELASSRSAVITHNENSAAPSASGTSDPEPRSSAAK